MPIVNALDPECVTELAIAADVLFDETVRPNDPHAVIDALSLNNPTVGAMIPTVLVLCARLVNYVSNATAGVGRPGVTARLVELALADTWQREADEVERGKAVVHAVVLADTTQGAVSEHLVGESEGHDFVSLLQFVVATSAVISMSDASMAAPGDAIRKVSAL